MQNPHVLLGGALGVLFDQQVICQAEATARKQITAIAIVRKSPRLAHQPIDDVPVIHPVLAAATQPWQPLQQALRVPYLQVLGVQPGLHPFPNQPAGHRVGVARDVDRAARIDPYPQPSTRLQPPRRQGSEHGQLLGQACLPTGIQLTEQVTHKRRIAVFTGKITAAPQQEGLIQSAFELPVALLGIAVLMATAGVDRLPLQTVVAQQCLVTLRERLPLLARWNGGGEPIGAVNLRHAAQLPQGILQTVAETLQALGETDRARFPVGIGQHKVKDQMREGHPCDRDLQTGAVREVGGAQPARFVHLRKEDFLGRPLHRPPLLEATLQGAELTVGEPAGKAPLQIRKQGLGLQPCVEP
jgi:hypothetical protein